MASQTCCQVIDVAVFVKHLPRCVWKGTHSAFRSILKAGWQIGQPNQKISPITSDIMTLGLLKAEETLTQRLRGERGEIGWGEGRGGGNRELLYTT